MEEKVRNKGTGMRKTRAQKALQTILGIFGVYPKKYRKLRTVFVKSYVERVCRKENDWTEADLIYKTFTLPTAQRTYC